MRHFHLLKDGGETVVGLEGEPLFFSNVEWGFAKKHKGAWKALPE